MDDGALGGFGELEYHAPAVGAGTGQTTHTDLSQVWAFSGPAEAVGRIARLLLGEVFAEK